MNELYIIRLSLIHDFFKASIRWDLVAIYQNRIKISNNLIKKVKKGYEKNHFKKYKHCNSLSFKTRHALFNLPLCTRTCLPRYKNWFNMSKSVSYMNDDESCLNE